MILTLLLCKFPWSVEVISHVGDSASEEDLLADLTVLNRVGSDVWRLRDYLSRVLLAPEVLLDLNEVGLMFISGFIISLLDLALILEAFLISDSDLPFTVFFACQTCDRYFVSVAERVIARFTEQDTVDRCTFLDGFSTDVGWVDHDFFDLTIGIQSRYLNKGSAW